MAFIYATLFSHTVKPGIAKKHNFISISGDPNLDSGSKLQISAGTRRHNTMLYEDRRNSNITKITLPLCIHLLNFIQRKHKYVIC